MVLFLCVQVFQLGTCRQCVQRISDANTQPGSGYYSTRSVKVPTKFRGNFHLIYCNILLKHLVLWVVVFLIIVTRRLFLDHVKQVASFVSRKGKVAIMWDDMLRNMPHSEIRDSGVGGLVEVMAWSYVDNLDTYLDYSTWRTYAELFRGVWAASAYKGATGERAHVPDILHHVQVTRHTLL